MNTRGLGRIFQRAGSPFWWVSYYRRGKEIREAAKNPKTGEKLQAIEGLRDKAEKFLADRLHDVKEEKKRGLAFIGPQQERITIDQLLDGLEADFKERGKWNAKIASNMKPVREHFGARRAISLTRDDVSKHIESLREQGYTNSTVNHRTKLLRQAFKVAMRNKQLSQAPFIPRLSEVGNERQGFFETADFEAMCAKLPDYLRDFSRFGFVTGWRKGSIESLRWSDVGEDVIYLRAENSKTRKPETIPLEGDLQEIIERRRAAAVIQGKDKEPRFAEYVFHRDGEPIGDFRKAWATACKQANVSHRLFHDLRRTASRNMIKAGVPQAVAMKITGHRTDSIFRRYAIVDEQQKREALAKTQQFVASTSRKIVRMGAGK